MRKKDARKSLVLAIAISTAPGMAVAATQEEVSGTISSMRSVTTYHTNQASHGEVLFQLSSPLATGCSWLSIKDGNSTTVSFLLSAQAQGKPVRVWYYSDLKSSAWGSACHAANVEIK